MRRTDRAVAAAVAGLLSVGCAWMGSSLPSRTPSLSPSKHVGSRGPAPVHLLFGGDTMLGRGVAARILDAPGTVFAELRPAVRAADVAVANLESPLTRRPHAVTDPNVLEADPAAARILAGAGFDAMVVANNHAGDAGPRTVRDTTRALSRAGIRSVGTATPAGAPRIVYETVRGIRIAFLAFDASEDGEGAIPPARGVTGWRPDAARSAVRRAARSAEVVTVSLHGGLAFGLDPDPRLARLARSLARWGADVVWCSGPHALQAIGTINPDRDGRPTVVATSLGNLLFDGGPAGPPRGAVLEVWVGADGVEAYRAGLTTYGSGRVGFLRWLPVRHPG